MLVVIDSLINSAGTLAFGGRSSLSSAGRRGGVSVV